MVLRAVTPYYDDGQVTIYHGDCREILPELAAARPGTSGGVHHPAAIITDPPYGVGVKYGDGYDDSATDYWPWFRECVGLMRAAAPVVAFTHRVKALAELTDWDWIAVWSKPYSGGARVGNSPVLPHWEPIFLYGIHSIGTRTDVLSDVLTYNPQGNGLAHGLIGRERHDQDHSESAQHPTPKPLMLYRRLVSTLSPAGGIVLDPFMGSGTTLVAAVCEGRRAIGIEIEERYCEVAVQRLRQMPLFSLSPAAGGPAVAEGASFDLWGQDGAS